MVTVQRTKDAGWCAGLHAGLAVALGGKTPPKVEFRTWSPKRRTGNHTKVVWRNVLAKHSATGGGLWRNVLVKHSATKARRSRPSNAGPSTGPRKSPSTGPRAAELAFYFRGCATPHPAPSSSRSFTPTLVPNPQTKCIPTLPLRAAVHVAVPLKCARRGFVPLRATASNSWLI